MVMERGVLIMGLDSDEVKIILDKHDEILSGHGKDIQQLQINTASLREKIISVEGIVTRFEANSYQTQNNMMQLLSQVIVNTSNGKIEMAKEDSKSSNDIVKMRLGNRANITLKILGIIGGIISAVVVGYLSLKGVSIPPVM